MSPSPSSRQLTSAANEQRSGRILTDHALATLQARGHAINPRRPSTSANSLAVTPQGYVGAADPRTRGALAVGY
jgi:gamma-glutamyltranspeptidase / glutathione hydrolase